LFAHVELLATCSRDPIRYLNHIALPIVPLTQRLSIIHSHKAKLITTHAKTYGRILLLTTHREIYRQIPQSPIPTTYTDRHISQNRFPTTNIETYGETHKVHPSLLT